MTVLVDALQDLYAEAVDTFQGRPGTDLLRVTSGTAALLEEGRKHLAKEETPAIRRYVEHLDCILHLFRLALSRELSSRAATVLRRKQAPRLLRALRSGDRRITDLSRNLRLDASYLEREVDHLVEADLVRTSKRGRDRWVTLSMAGRNALDELSTAGSHSRAHVELRRQLTQATEPTDRRDSRRGDAALMASWLAMRQRGLQRERFDVTLARGIHKQLAQGSIMRLRNDEESDLPAIPTGVGSLDAALGIGGMPRGRVVEISGPESSGKTTLAFHVIAEVQKRGGLAAILDAEHGLDPRSAARLGVDTETLLVAQPESGTQTLEIAEILIRSGALDVLVIDSVAALLPQAEVEGTVGHPHLGAQARLVSQSLRKLTSLVSKSRTCLILINDASEENDTIVGNPETPTRGRALDLHSSIRLDTRRIGSLKDFHHVIGARGKVKVVKNELAAPYGEVDFEILSDQPIGREEGLPSVGFAQKFMEKVGAWYTLHGERLGRDRVNVLQFLKDNADVRREIDDLLRSELGLHPVGDATDGSETARGKDEAAPTGSGAKRSRA